MQICLESKTMFHIIKMVDRNSGDFDKRQKCGRTEGGAKRVMIDI